MDRIVCALKGEHIRLVRVGSQLFAPGQITQVNLDAEVEVLMYLTDGSTLRFTKRENVEAVRNWFESIHSIGPNQSHLVESEDPAILDLTKSPATEARP